MRNLKTIGIVLGSFLFALGVSFVLNIAFINSADAASTIQGLTTSSIFAYWGYLATKVGYRWWDCAFGLIPFYGLFWIFKIAYRVAFLPNCDWKLNENS